MHQARLVVNRPKVAVNRAARSAVASFHLPLNALSLLPHHTAKFLSPFDRPSDYNGSEKFQLACHADRLFAFVVDGSVREEDLHRCFSAAARIEGDDDEEEGDQSYDGGGEEEGTAPAPRRGRRKKKSVTKISRNLLAANLLDMRLEDAKKLAFF